MQVLRTGEAQSLEGGVTGLATGWLGAGLLGGATTALGQHWMVLSPGQRFLGRKSVMVLRKVLACCGEGAHDLKPVAQLSLVLLQTPVWPGGKHAPPAPELWLFDVGVPLVGQH